MNYFKLKFLLLFFALAVAIPPAWAETVKDELTLSTFGVSGNTYTDVSGKKATSDAVYAGNLAGGNDAIQLRTDNSTSGIITTTSGGKVKSIKITFNSNTTAGRIVNVYGKSSAYTAASELYNTNTRGKSIGALNIDAGTTGTITIPEGEEYSYIGIKSSSKAIYLDKIEIVWETEGGGETPVKQDLTTFAFSSATASATLGETFNAPTLTVNPTVDVTDVTYSSSDPDVATVANDGTVTLVGAGTTTITASFAGNDEYNAATASYNLTVNAAQPTGLITDFFESFDQTNGTGGNDGSWSGNNIASSNITTDKQGWTFENEGGAKKCIKLGASSKKGTATTPSITVTPGITYTLTFKAGAWSGDKTTLNLSATGGDLSATSVTMTSADWQAYSITFTATDETARIKFEGFQASKARFFLDEVRLTHDQNATPVTVVAKPEFSVAGGNYTTAQSVEISCATEDATIYYTTDGSEPTASSTEYTGAITISETTTLKAIAVKDGQSSAVAEATYTIKTVTSVANLQAANALDDDTEFIYTGEAVVVWRDGNQMWLQDPNANVGGALVYGNVVSSFSSKDKLKSGWTAKKGTYNNASQFTEFSAEKDGNQDASPFERTSISADNVHEYVLLKGVSISSDKKSLTFPGENGNTLTVYNKFNKLPETINATSTYDIKGIIVLFGGSTLEIYPLGYEEHSAAVVEVKAPEFTYNNEAITGSSVEVNANDKITITSEEGTTLIYTTDGSNPSESATALLTDGNTAEVTITEACTIKAVALDGDANESEVATLAVTISEPVQPGESRTYQKVTSTDQVTTGKYLIVYEHDNIAFDGSLETLDASNNIVEVTITDGEIETDKDIYFTYDATAQTLKSASNKYIGQSSYANGLKQDEDATKYTNSITIDDGNAVITALQSGNNNQFTTLRFNSVTGDTNYRFRYYKSGQQPIQLYKEVTGDVPVVPELSVSTETLEMGTEPTGTFTVTGQHLTEDVTVTVTGENATKFTVEPATITMADAMAEGGKTVTVTYKGTSTTDEYATITVKSGTASKEVIVTARVLPTPEIIADPESLTMAAVVGQTPATATFTVMASDLRGDITLTMSESDVFTIEPATIRKADMTEDGVEVTVTYKPTQAGNDNATITIASEAAESVTVTLAGTATLPVVPELSVSTETLEMGTEPTGTFTVTGQNLTENVTLTVTEGEAKNFEISPASITPNEEGKVDKEVTVTYKGTSTTDEYATITVKSGTASKEVIVTARVLPTPEIIADPESLTMAAKVGETATATLTVMASDLRGDITLTMSESDVFTIEPATIRKADMTEDGVEVTVTYKPTQAGNDNATITIASEAAESVTVTLAGTATVPEVVAMPTFSLVAGSYTGPQQVIINCATEGATISYSTDGGSTWTKGNTVNVDKDMTIMAKAERDGMTVSTTASATYVIITEEAPVPVNIETGYYQIKNLGNRLYANVAGRKTLNFTDAENAEKMAGTVIYVDVENDGTVKSLRSQAADLQRYADRAMSYVPEVVKIVAKKLNADGSGEILGETGLGKILDKFNECFDHNLHVEQAEGGYRLYGKTPSMQPVVEFYRENQDKVEAKLPNLEAFINSALEKLKAKIGGSSVFTEFKLHDIWDKMGGTLTEPTDAASTMAFYREVLNNKNYVWDFAYQTAMIYVNNLMSHDRWSEVEALLGEYAQYIDKIKQIRPEFKYYIVQKDGKPDFISEGNKDIIDKDPRTIWSLEKRDGFTVNFPKDNKHNGEYVTTLYTDFAYTLPKGVTAYAVTEVSTQGVATLTALEGTIPAQTPVLLKSTAAGAQTVTLSTEAGTAPADNLLVGPDYLIKTYEIKTPQVEKIFEIIQNKLPGFYEEYVAQYEYLMLKTAGTVGNKYFWGLNKDEIIFDNNCVVRSLDVQDGTVAFYDNATVSTNKAFLVDDVNNPQDVIKLSLRGDINKDGVISIIDVTALIDILLDLPKHTYLDTTTSYPKGLDYEAADVNENKDIEITDVTTLIDILLNMPDQPAQGSGN